MINNIILVLLYILGGIGTLIFYYQQTEDEGAPVDFLLFLLWPFAIFPVIALCLLYTPILFAKYVARKLK